MSEAVDVRQRRKVPIRTCVACRTSSGKAGLVRIVRAADGGVRVDSSGKAPGRGAYVCRTQKCVDQAIKQKRLGRALRCEIPEGLASELNDAVAAGDAQAGNRGDGKRSMKA